VAHEGWTCNVIRGVAVSNSSPQTVCLSFFDSIWLGNACQLDWLSQSLHGDPPKKLRFSDRTSLLVRVRLSEIRSQVLSGARFGSCIVIGNRYYISAGIIVAVAEAALIVLLFAQWRQHKYARKALEQRFAVELVITRMSSRLIDCPPELLSIEIETGLRELLNAENVDQVTWCNVPQDTMSTPHFIQRAGIGSHPVFPSEMPWFVSRLLNGEIVAIAHLKTIPDCAAEDREYLSRSGVKSIIEVPCTLVNRTKGVLGLACFNRERPWPATLINQLVVLGNLVGDAVLRNRSTEAERASEQRFRHLFEQAPVGIALEDLDGKVLLVNPALCSMLGYSKEEMLALRCDQFADPEDSAEDWKLFQELKAGLRLSYQIDKRYALKDGTKVWGHLNVSRLASQTAGAPLVLAMVEDISARREAEEKWKQAQAVLHDLPSRLIQAQEEEKQHIARELHDDIGQRLSLLTVELEQVNRELPIFPMGTYGQFAELLQGMDEVTTDVHQLSHQLHSSKLQYLGLRAALRELCQQIAAQHDITVLQRVEDVRDLTPDVQLCFYRVAQEALNNVVRHSSAKTASVRLSHNRGMARLEIRDVGVGFDVRRTGENLGLASMRERLRSVNGTFSVSSFPGHGTQIVAEVPFKVETDSQKPADLRD
jgi:PAS domain S-box-containing protein